ELAEVSRLRDRFDTRLAGPPQGVDTMGVRAVCFWGRSAQAGPKPMVVCCPSDTSGRNFTGSPILIVSSGISTRRPNIDRPSSSLTTATAYGASGARPRGGIRITVNEITFPAPLRGTVSHWRRWQVGQNSLGGTASAPHPPHLRAVRRPARASSKKVFSVIPRSVTAEQAHQPGG